MVAQSLNLPSRRFVFRVGSGSFVINRREIVDSLVHVATKIHLLIHQTLFTWLIYREGPDILGRVGHTGKGQTHWEGSDIVGRACHTGKGMTYWEGSIIQGRAGVMIYFNPPSFMPGGLIESGFLHPPGINESDLLLPPGVEKS